MFRLRRNLSNWVVDSSVELLEHRFKVTEESAKKRMKKKKDNIHNSISHITILQSEKKKRKFNYTLIIWYWYIWKTTF